MALNMEVLRVRLREAFGKDSQETIGSKLNMTQGNVSKLLSGSQQPTLETIYHIAQVYDVSVDWLLGLSDRKKISKAGINTSYAEAVSVLHDLKNQQNVGVETAEDGTLTLKVIDPLLLMLLKKSIMLYDADRDLFNSWRDTRLSLFENKKLLYGSIWNEGRVWTYAREAANESHWLEVYQEAELAEKDWVTMMSDSPGLFDT